MHRTKRKKLAHVTLRLLGVTTAFWPTTERLFLGGSCQIMA